MPWTYNANRLRASELGSSDVQRLFTLAYGTKNCPYCEVPVEEMFRLSASDSQAGDTYLEIIRKSHGVRVVRPHFDPEPPVPERGLFPLGHSTADWHLVTAREVVCQLCGWWAAFRDFLANESSIHTHAGVGSLCEFDPADLGAPLDEVRRFLTARWHDRQLVHPRLFEETVASVFGDIGYHAVVTAYSGDGGIDVVLEDAAGTRVGVQVKRYQNSIEASQIRELVGALVLRGISKGAFVTTSQFRAGARREAAEAALRGIPVELYDAPRFFDALRIAQREQFSAHSLDEAPFRTSPLSLVHINYGQRVR